MLLAEHLCWLAAPGHWSHEVIYQLFDRVGSDLSIQFPTGSRLLSVTLDRNRLAALQPSRDRLWVPLVGPVGAHVLRIQWIYDEGEELLEQLRLDTLTVEGVTDAPTMWTLYVPPGFIVQPGTTDVTAATAVSRDLRRAGADLELSRLLAESGLLGTNRSYADQLQDVQRSFYRFCLLADQRFVKAEPPTVQINELRERNAQLAQVHGFQEIRARAEQLALAPPSEATLQSSGSTGETGSGAWRWRQGTTTYWTAAGGSHAPFLTLLRPDVLQVREAITRSGVVLMMLLLVFSLGFVPGAMTLARSLWPEQLILAGMLGAALAGWSGLWLLLVCAGAGARLLSVSRRLVHRARLAAVP
jgi:hypothetical protein